MASRPLPYRNAALLQYISSAFSVAFQIVVQMFEPFRYLRFGDCFQVLLGPVPRTYHPPRPPTYRGPRDERHDDQPGLAVARNCNRREIVLAEQFIELLPEFFSGHFVHSRLLYS